MTPIGCEIDHHFADSGGAVFHQPFGNVTFPRCRIETNSANFAPGIENGDGGSLSIGTL